MNNISNHSSETIDIVDAKRAVDLERAQEHMRDLGGLAVDHVDQTEQESLTYRETPNRDLMELVAKLRRHTG